MAATVFDLIALEAPSVQGHSGRESIPEERHYYTNRLSGPWTLYLYRKQVRGQPKKAPYATVYQLQDAADFANLAKILTYAPEAPLVQDTPSVPEAPSVPNFWQGHFALMRNNVTPIWEDRANKDGGALEVLFQERISAETLITLLAQLVTNQLLAPDSEFQINGITFERVDELHFENGLKVSIWTDLNTGRADFMQALLEPARTVIQKGKGRYLRHQEQGNFGSYSRHH